MPARVFWDASNSSIIIREMSGNWTWEEYFQAVQQVHQLIESVDYRVDVIVDCRNMIQFPTAALPNIRNANKAYSANMGVQVIVASSRIVEVFANMLRKTSPDAMNHYLFKHTIEEAYDEVRAAREAAGDSENV